MRAASNARRQLRAAINARNQNARIPNALIYALLPDKTENSYERVFKKILELRPGLAPTSVMSDFEMACLNAFCKTFPRATQVGCFFHLGQCLWRKVQDHNLVNAYKTDENVRLYIKMLLALSFVPVAHVAEAFSELVEQSPDGLDDINDYWEDNFIGRLQRRGRRNPRFDVKLWNMYDRVNGDLPRTNNSVEAWHLSFQQTVDCHHPSVYKLVEHLRKEQDHTEILIARFLAGHVKLVSAKSTYAKLNRRIKTLVTKYDEANNYYDYLHGIAYNVQI